MSRKTWKIKGKSYNYRDLQKLAMNVGVIALGPGDEIAANIQKKKTLGKPPAFKGRFWQKRFKKQLVKESKIRVMKFREAKQHENIMRDLQGQLRGKLAILQRKKRKTKEDNREIKRLRKFQEGVSRQKRIAKYVASQIKRFRPPKGTKQEANVPRCTESLDSANLALIESAQRVRYPKDISKSERRMIQREWGGGIKNVQFYGWTKGAYRTTQGMEIAPYNPNFAQGPKHDFGFHTHPERRELKRIKYGRFELIDPRGKSRISEKTKKLAAKGNKRAQKTIQTAKTQREKGDALLYKLQQDVYSIRLDDRPSAQDIYSTLYGNRPGLIATPRRNIKLVPGRNATAIIGMGKDPIDFRKDEKDQFKRKMRNEIDSADSFAWERSQAGKKARSIGELKERIKDYQRLREQAIAAVIEKNAGVRVIYSRKGRKIKFPKK